MSSASTVNSASQSDVDSDDDFTPLRCWDCNVNFTSKHYLYAHLYHHIKQPTVILERTPLPSLKITLKTRGNSFEIVNSPTQGSSEPEPEPELLTLSDTTKAITTSNLAETEENAENDSNADQVRGEAEDEGAKECDELNVRFSPSFADVPPLDSVESPPNSDISNSGFSTPNTIDENSTANVSDYGSVPGAEPTPPPEPSPDYPKIRIKTTGLLKEPLTITEITDDNPTGDPSLGFNFLGHHTEHTDLWPPSLEDPLKLPENDDNNLLSLFNNNERAKDLGFITSDSEYISLDRLEERNRGAVQVYNPPTSNNQQSPLDSLTGLPMQALAQQVSRLQPSGGNGVHQQNVLINIQQFPSAPPQPTYQPPPMYQHHPPHPTQPMYPPYPQYQPPNPMYYPPAPNYPQHMPPPPQPQQMNQMGQQPPMNQQQPQQQQQPPPQQMGQPPPPVGQQQQMGQQQNQMHPNQPQQNMNQQQYRQPMPPRQNAPRQPGPGQRMPNPRPMGQRQPMTRQRAPMMRPRGGAVQPMRGVRPRMSTPQNGQVRPQQPVKRTPEQIQALQAKKKRFDVLTPDKDDDDCQVICMQPKNTDGGLPQIESVQGGTPEPAESSIMHLSDSITLSVRNPPPKPVESPKKSDAKAVANILATRGITVTATAKAKEKAESQKAAPTIPASLNLNGAVSILPAAKTGSPAKTSNTESLPTVDLTDDSAPPAQSPKQSSSPQKSNQRPGLPYRCDLCPAQYPNPIGLSKHRQTYHKTTSGMCELGIPVINMKQPGVLQRLSSLGIHNYIPLPSSGSDGTFVLPVINSRNPGNMAALHANSMITLGPIRTIPKPQNNVNNNAAKQLNNQK